VTMFTRAVALLSLVAGVAANASTTVAILEIGKGGVIRRTTSSSPKTSVRGVTSFWDSLHDVEAPKGRRLSKAQQPGMTVVPDLFGKASGGILLGLVGNGVDLDAMPFVSGLLKSGTNADKMGFVGHFELAGHRGEELLNKAAEPVEATNEYESVHPLVTKVLSGGNKLHTGSLQIDNVDAASKADSQVGKMLDSLIAETNKSGSTIIVHLVVEEEEGSARRRMMSRQLEEDEESEDSGDEDGDDAAGDDADNQYNGYYGWGYYNDYGEWVTNYRTIFQIQYYNVILWSSVGLFLILYYAIVLMIHMPLEADTLLFGESAKMVG